MEAVRNKSQYYGTADSTTANTQQQPMSMKEALAKAKGSDQGVLEALDEEGKKNSFGDLFEYSQVTK